MAGESAVDVHAHGIPRAVVDEIRRNGDRYGGMSVADSEQGPVVAMPGGRKLRALAPKMLDFDHRLQWLDGHGMRGQVVSPWLDLQGHELDPEKGADWAKVLNDALAEACAGSGGRLIPLGTVPFGDAAASVRELRRLVQELKVPGAMISTNPGETALTDPSLDDLWSAAEDLGALIVFHPPTIGPASYIPDSAEYGNLWLRLIDTTFVVSRLILAGTFDRHPRLKMVLVHGGGFLPFQSGRFDRNYVTGGHPAANIKQGAPSDYLRNFFYDTCVMSPPAIRLLCDLVGADRVVLGSDYPFPIGDPDPVKSVDGANLGAESTRHVLQGNAANLVTAVS